jgi:DNA-binding NarL/FixJ family response regulator
VIRVVIADDHGVVRAGLAQLVATFAGVEVVGLAADGRQAVDMCASLAPDVCLMDLEMPGINGVEAIAAIRAAGLPTSLVVLTSFADRERIIGAVDAGAVGYLLKDAEPGDLERGIRAAARGEAPLDPRAARELLGPRTSGGPAVAAALPGDGLSPREREVLVLLGRGMPNKVIALRLGISEKTVKAHLTNVFRTIGVTDRTQAALWAERHGLLDGS